MEQVLAELGNREQGEVVLETALSYGTSEPVRVRVRKRGNRYDIDDDANAVRLSGKPQGWLEVAEGLMVAHGLNVNRRGAVHVPVHVGRDIAALVLSVADTSLTLYSALIEVDVEVGFDSDTSVD